MHALARAYTKLTMPTMMFFNTAPLEQLLYSLNLPRDFGAASSTARLVHIWTEKSARVPVRDYALTMDLPHVSRRFGDYARVQQRNSLSLLQPATVIKIPSGWASMTAGLREFNFHR